MEKVSLLKRAESVFGLKLLVQKFWLSRVTRLLDAVDANIFFLVVGIFLEEILVGNLFWNVALLLRIF